MNRRRTTAVVALALAVLLLGGPVAALAAFADTISAGHDLSTTALATPTNPATAHGPCSSAVSASIVVSWTRTTSSWADGYEVLSSLTSGGPYTLAATASGSTTESATAGGLLFSTTYYFVVRATKAGWRSANTAQVALTTKTPLCL